MNKLRQRNISNIEKYSWTLTYGTFQLSTENSDNTVK